MRIRSLHLAILILVAIVAGCGGEEGKSGPAAPGPDATADFDQDQLTDLEEREVYHTSPRTRDTDGDAFDDYQEIHEFGFDSANPTMFNPCVADVPRIEIELTSPPKVSVDYQKSTGETETIETGRTKDTATTATTARTIGHSHSVTTGMTISHEATVSGSFAQGLSASATTGVSLSVSATNEQSFSWTGTQAAENRTALSEMRSNSQNRDLTQTGGLVKISVAITNAGHIPFTVQNLMLTARRVEGPLTWPVAQLEVVSARSFFDMGTWVPGERVELDFEARLTLAEVEEILTGDLLIQVGKVELVDVNKQPFAHRAAAIDAACAKILIDYGGRRPDESYCVSTRTSLENGGVPLNEILDTLGLEHESGSAAWNFRKRSPDGRLATGADATDIGRTKSGLLRLRDVATDSQRGGYWLIDHQVPVAPSETSTHRCNLLYDDYRLEDLLVKARHIVAFTFIEDPDHDNLGSRAETALRTDPWQADTDGDTVADGDEIAAGTDPLWDETRTLPTIVSVEPTQTDRLVSIDIVIEAPDVPAERLLVNWGDGSLTEEIDQPGTAVSLRHRYADFGDYRVIVTATGGPRPSGSRHECDVSIRPSMVRDLLLQLGTDGPDLLQQIEVDVAGNIYLGGDIENQSPLGSDRGPNFIVKFDREGRKQWVQQRDMVSADRRLPNRCEGLAVGGPEGPIFLGRSEYPARGGSCSLLSVFDAAGKRTGLTGYGDNPEVRDVAIDERGNFVVAQERWKNPLVSTSEILRLRRTSGAPKADAPALVLGGGGSLRVRAMALDAEGAIYVVGGGLKREMRKGGGSFIARIEPQSRGGRQSWIRWHGDHRSDQSVAVAVDGVGNAWVVDVAAGRTPEQANIGRTDARLAKYAPDGKLLFQRQFGTRLHDLPLSVAVLPPRRAGGAETIWVAGITQGDLADQDAELDPSAAKFDLFLVSFDSGGNRTSLRQFVAGGGLPTEFATTALAQGRSVRALFPVSAHVATDAHGGVYLAGSSMHSLGDGYTNRGDADLFLMRFIPNPEFSK